jgi:hypothetical protein
VNRKRQNSLCSAVVVELRVQSRRLIETLDLKLCGPVEVLSLLVISKDATLTFDRS